MARGITHGMGSLGAQSPSDYLRRQIDYTLEDCAQLIRCPTLVVDSEREQFFAGQSRRLYDALQCPKTIVVFRNGEGADLHKLISVIPDPGSHITLLSVLLSKYRWLAVWETVSTSKHSRTHS